MMMRFMFAVPLLTSMTACTMLVPSKSQTEVAPPAIEYPHVKRPNLVVSDLSRSLTIYRDILDLTASDISDYSEDSYSYPVFNIPKGVPIRGVTLHEPGEQRVLALTELASLDLPAPANAPHMSAVVIGVTDLMGKFEQIAALGLTVTEPKIASGSDFDFVEQAFVDFDGHLIVLYEVLPGSTD
jgi:catechol 2,3-dioxygenase-like lactoylglutathione lyase family enzyme